MDNFLRCNNHKPNYCRKQLQNQAVVTSCSHAFCIECIKDLKFEIQRKDQRKCPACDNALPRDNDAIVTELAPSEEYKSTALSGLNPPIIIECASRALAFWNYQMSTETAWQQHLVTAMTEKYGTLNNQMKVLVKDANTQIQELQKEIEALVLEKQEIQVKNEEIAQMYRQKSKRCQQVEQLYEACKKKVQYEQSRDAAGIAAEHTLHSFGATPRPESLAPNHHRSHSRAGIVSMYGGSRHSMPTNGHGVEQLHPFQRSGSATRGKSSQDHAVHMMPPPRRPVGREAFGRTSAHSTPASQRITLAQPSAARSFPHLSNLQGAIGLAKSGFPGISSAINERIKTSDTYY